jgi:hypothetical protein
MHAYEVRPRKAPPLGRALRILIGLALIVYVTPVFFRAPLRFTGKVLLLMVGLIGLYSLLHIVVSRRIVAFSSSLGAVVAAGLLSRDFVAKLVCVFACTSTGLHKQGTVSAAMCKFVLA